MVRLVLFSLWGLSACGEAPAMGAVGIVDSGCLSDGRYGVQWHETTPMSDELEGLAIPSCLSQVDAGQ